MKSLQCVTPASAMDYVVLHQLLSIPERTLICFRLSFLATTAAAGLWSPLIISLIIRRFQTIFGSYTP